LTCLGLWLLNDKLLGRVAGKSRSLNFKAITGSSSTARFVKLELSLAGGVKELRERLCVRKVGLRQMGLGENAGLSQRRVGEMEAGYRFVFGVLRLG
jgi:hypothetical protein